MKVSSPVTRGAPVSERRQAPHSGLGAPLRGNEGYTLTELVVVMGILTVVVTALTTMFVSGATAEVDQSRRLEAQQSARGALAEMRRDLHCATALAATPGVPVSSVTATVPAVCLGQTGSPISVTYATVAAGPSRWEVRRTQGAVTKTVADYLTNASPFTYTAPSSATLGKLRVDFPVQVKPGTAQGRWHLVDDVVLRNTVRA